MYFNMVSWRLGSVPACSTGYPKHFVVFDVGGERHIGNRKMAATLANYISLQMSGCFLAFWYIFQTQLSKESASFYCRMILNYERSTWIFTFFVIWAISFRLSHFLIETTNMLGIFGRKCRFFSVAETSFWNTQTQGTKYTNGGLSMTDSKKMKIYERGQWERPFLACVLGGGGTDKSCPCNSK